MPRPSLNQKLFVQLLNREHKSGWAIFIEPDYKNNVGTVARRLFEAAVGDQRERDAEAERPTEVSHEA